MPHIGTVDVDLCLDAEALADGEYVQLVESLLRRGYYQTEGQRRFQLVRTVPARDGGNDIDIIIDFLMSRDARIERNIPRSYPVSRCNAPMARIFLRGSISLLILTAACLMAGATASSSRSCLFPHCWPWRDTPSRIASSRRTLTISTTASVTFRAAWKRLSRKLNHFLSSERRERVISILPRNFDTRTISVRLRAAVRRSTRHACRAHPRTMAAGCIRSG